MLNTKSKNSKETNDAVGCPRGGTITRSLKFPFSASTPVRELCLSDFSPVCSAPGLEESDKRCSERPNKKRVREPLFAPGDHLEQRHKFKLPSLLESSMPPSADAKLVAAAWFESGVRTISEWMLCNMFCLLPQGTAATLARNQLAAACDCGFKRSLPLPCQQCQMRDGRLKRTEELVTQVEIGQSTECLDLWDSSKK
jgi:hypothetical protein